MRDVQSIALASFGLELDRRDHLGRAARRRRPRRATAAAEPRPSIVAITAEASGLRSLVRVTLALDDEAAVGFAEGSIATTARHRLVALGDRRLAAPARAGRRVRRRRPRADHPDRRARRRHRHGGVRDPARGAAGVGLGDRAPAAGGRRGGPRRARRDQPSPRVRLGPLARPIVGAMAPQAVTVSFRLGGDDGVSVEARKWASALQRARLRRPGASRARSKTSGEPDDVVVPGLAIDAARRRDRRPNDELHAALDGADLVIVDNLCSLPLNVDGVARRRARRRTTAAACLLPPPRSSVAAAAPRRPRGGVPAAHRRRVARDDQPAEPPRAARARLRRRGDDPQLLRSRPAGRRPRDDPQAVRLRRRRLRAVPTGARDRAQERPGGGALRAPAPRRSRPRSRCASGSRARPRTATARSSTASSNARRFRSPSGAPRRRRRRVRGLAISSCSRRRGRASATRSSSRSRTGARARRIRIPVLAEIVAAGVRVFSTQQPENVVKFLAEQPGGRATASSRRTSTAPGCRTRIADLPAAIDEAFADARVGRRGRRRSRPRARRAHRPLRRTRQTDRLLARSASRSSAFFVGVATSFPTWTVAVSIAGLAVSSVVLPIPIVLGYGVRGGASKIASGASDGRVTLAPARRGDPDAQGRSVFRHQRGARSRRRRARRTRRPARCGCAWARPACATPDLSVVNGTLLSPLPAVLGHEGAGIVDSVGDGVERGEARRPRRAVVRPAVRTSVTCAPTTRPRCARPASSRWRWARNST